MSFFLLLVSLSSRAHNAYPTHNQCFNLFEDKISKPSSSQILLSIQKASVALYNDAQPIVNYQETLSKIINTLKLGKTVEIIFPNNRSVEVRNFLGNGETTFVFETTDGYALRVPIEYELSINTDHKNPILTTWFIDDYIKLQNELSLNNIKVPKIFLDKSLIPYFLITEKIDVKFLLVDYIQNYNTNMINEKDKKIIDEQLLKFARSTWMYKNIGDFNGEQVAFNGYEWVLFDFANKNTLIEHQLQIQNTFTPTRFEQYTHHYVTKELYKKISKAIRDERHKKAYLLRQNKTFYNAKTWIQRKTKNSGFTLTHEISVFNLVNSKFDLFRINFKKNDELDKTLRHNSLISIKFDRFLNVNKKTALYEVTLENKIKAMAEIALNDENPDGSDFNFLKKLGYSKNDLIYSSYDLKIVLKK
ncbi:MAG: hypothetical protein ACK41T_09470 [Pseudobdellovibrio sp.]